MNTATANTAVYSAIRAYAESEKAKGNGWASLSVAVASLSAAEAEGVCAETEGQFKRNNPKAGVPAAFRSAKSVALKALRLGVALVGPDGEAIGKTAIEKACKAAQAEADAAELAAIEGDEAQAGELVIATAEEFRARFAALILAANESGFDPTAIFADAYARTLPQDAL